MNKKGYMIIEKYFSRVLLIAIIFLFGGIGASHATSLFFSPATGSYDVGNTITATVNVESIGQAINAASGIVSFPPGTLEVLSVSKVDSIFSLWVQEPSFSNSAGTVSFEGIVLNPGFTGPSGKILTVRFRAKGGGATSLSISQASVLANDGAGTNVLKSVGSASYNISVVSAPPPSSGPGAPKVISPTHPNSKEWYTKTDAKFEWDLPSGVSAVRLLFGELANSSPTVLYDPPINEKIIEGVRDGTWFFHAQFLDNKGWGSISHFRFNVDNSNPSYFSVGELERADRTNPRATFLLDSADETSGIDRYEIQIDNGPVEVWRDNVRDGIYTTSPMGPGDHRALFKAIDRAGNFLSVSKTFSIDPIDSPIIIQYPSELNSKDTFVLRGKTNYPISKVIIVMIHDGVEVESQEVVTREDGSFTFVASEKLELGLYKVLATAVDYRLAKSLPWVSEPIAIKKSGLLSFGISLAPWLPILVPLIAIIISLLYFLYRAWNKADIIHNKVDKEEERSERLVQRTFEKLSESVKNEIESLESVTTKRELTEEEKKIIKNLKEHLATAEKKIQRSLKKLKKEAHKR